MVIKSKQAYIQYNNITTTDYEQPVTNILLIIIIIIASNIHIFLKYVNQYISNKIK